MSSITVNCLLIIFEQVFCQKLSQDALILGELMRLLFLLFLITYIVILEKVITV